MKANSAKSAAAELSWLKSSHSSGSGGDCVEVAHVGAAAVLVRDSKRPGDAFLTVGAVQWAAFVRMAACG